MDIKNKEKLEEIQELGHGTMWAQGGRVGYRDGEFVDEDINIEGPGFDVNENIEMAEGGSFPNENTRING